jgi:hypothetical protein
MWQLSVPKLAFGIGISALLFALDTILLGKIPWQAMVRDALVTTNPERMTKIAELDADAKQQEPPAPMTAPKPRRRSSAADFKRDWPPHEEDHKAARHFDRREFQCAQREEARHAEEASC